ncbi:MAG: DUF4093 domain-containing protein [Ruminococcus sp.]|nr:DUF4093 domain-containing protein [Ruminococcus sp.]
MDRLKIKEAVIVEGKYDKIKLSAIIDGVIIKTDGFRLFRDEKLAALIRRYAEEEGIIILTDSDSAGFKIRSRIKSLCPGGRIVNIYIPDVPGKERRKAEPSREGKLGVEGIDTETLRELFLQAGVCVGEGAGQEPIGSFGMTEALFYELGLSGGRGARELRRRLARSLGLPELISQKALREHLDRFVSEDELRALCAELKGKEEEN